MVLFNSKTKFSKSEIIEFDSLFLNIHQIVKSEFKITSRHQQDIKNNPVNGESIHYSYLLKGKDTLYLSYVNKDINQTCNENGFLFHLNYVRILKQ